KIILDEMEQAEALMAESRSRPRGKLRISAPVTFGSHGLAPALPAFLRAHPEVSVELCLSNRTVDLVEENYDIVFRTGELPDSSLVARHLGAYPLVLCASPGYLQGAAPLETPEDLADHECLVFSHTSMRTAWSFDGPEGRVTVRIVGRFRTDSGEALRGAAVAGLGVMLQPIELVAEELRDGRLVRLLPEYVPCARPMHVLHASGRRATPKLRAFLDFAVRTFKYP
ncbi:LysR substrate-binding domain-containing protein, partial [Pseudomonas sp. NPDC089534]|uniref:LysR substrate-binding domain-containing protein n=1 Tax=Pseudomonas sp. NPDC089534 TaxID=3364468 RepID=UPI00380FC8B4